MLTASSTEIPTKGSSTPAMPPGGSGISVARKAGSIAGTGGRTSDRVSCGVAITLGLAVAIGAGATVDWGVGEASTNAKRYTTISPYSAAGTIPVILGRFKMNAIGASPIEMTPTKRAVSA